jgi:hypothetical protein
MYVSEASEATLERISGESGLVLRTLFLSIGALGELTVQWWWSPARVVAR